MASGIAGQAGDIHHNEEHDRKQEQHVHKQEQHIHKQGQVDSHKREGHNRKLELEHGHRLADIQTQ